MKLGKSTAHGSNDHRKNPISGAATSGTGDARGQEIKTRKGGGKNLGTNVGGSGKGKSGKSMSY